MTHQRLVARFATEPSRTQPEKATSALPPLFRPTGQQPTGDLDGIGCIARRMAVKVEGLHGPDPGGRSFLWGERHPSEGEGDRACEGGGAF